MALNPTPRAVGLRRPGGPALATATCAVIVAAVLLPPRAAWDGALAAPEGDSVRLVGHSGGPVRAVERISDTAWIAEGIGLTEVDIGDPEAPREAWHLLLGERADVWSVRASGAYLLAATSAGLYAVDPSGESGPRVVGHLETSRPARAVTPFRLPGGEEDLAILVAPGQNASIVRVSGDGTLQTAGVIAESEAVAIAAAVDGFRAVLAADEVWIVDITRPELPRLAASTSTLGPVRGLAVRDGIAYVSDAREGLLVVPLDAPTQRLGRLPEVAGGALVAHGALLYVLEQHPTGPNTVRLVDVADPARPEDVLGGESTYEVLRGALGMRVVGDEAVVALGHGMAIADLRDVRWPELRAEHTVTWPIVDLADAGECVYAAQSEQGLGAVAVRSPDRPERWVEWRPEGGVTGVHVRDGSAYVSAGNGMHRIVVRDACHPVPAETPFAADWPATRWLDSGDDLLVATSVDRFYVARIGGAVTVPLAAVDYASMPGWPVGAVAQGVALPDRTVAYVAAGAAGMAAISLADPTRPTVARVLPMPEGSESVSVAARGGWLVVGTTGGITVYDARSRLDPRLVGADPGPYVARALDLTDEGDLYVAADLDGLLILDISDPGRPYERSRWSPPFPVTDVVAGGSWVYAAAAGLAVLVEEPAGASPTPSATATETAEPSPTPAPPDPDLVCYVPALVQGQTDWP